MVESRSRARRPFLLVATLLAVTVGTAGAAQDDSSSQTLQLTLQDAVELTLRHSLQVRVNAFDQEIIEENITAAYAPFDTTVLLNVPSQFNRTTAPQSSQLGGADVLNNEVLAGGAQLSERLALGTSWNVQLNVSRFVTNNAFSTFNPRFDTSLTLNLTQPLLRNFGTKTNRRGILVAQNDFSVSREQFRLQVQQTIFQVIQAYWNLVFTVRDLEVANENRALAQEQLDRTQTMVRIGTMAPIETVQSEQAEADAALAVIQAENALANAKDTLKRQLNVESFTPAGWTVDIVAVGEPLSSSEPIDVEEAIQEAIANDPVVRQNRLNLESRRIDLHAARNQLLPQVDLIGRIALSGLGGDRIFRTDIFGGGISEIQEGGLPESLEQLFSGDFRDWSVGLQVSFPVGNSFARAQHAQASIRERQTAAQISDRELQLRLDVRTGARAIDSGVQQVAAALRARELADRQYAGELRRFEVGTGSNFQVLQFQRLLAQSRRREVQAVISFNVALANFERVKGTLLRSLGVTIDGGDLTGSGAIR